MGRKGPKGGKSAEPQGPPLPAVELRTVRLDDYDPAPYNPREIALDELAGLRGSIEAFGLVQPLVVNLRTKRLVGGHQRVKALRGAGETEALAAVVDLDEDREKALNVALNSEELRGEFTDEAAALARAIAGKVPELGDALRLRELADDVDVFARARREAEEGGRKTGGPGGDAQAPAGPTMAECPSCGHEFERPKKRG